MKYILLIYGAESGWTDSERCACMAESMEICRQLEAEGKLIAASPLQLVDTAKTVRLRSGQQQLTAGPFAETAEQLGGFYILQLDHLDQAIAIAGRLPPAAKGSVEIRPMVALAELPADRFERVQRHDPALTPYILLCYDDESAWRKAGPEALQAAMREAAGLAHELDAQGRYISAAPLHSVETATSLRVRDGQQMLMDGPFAETREVLGGFYLILARSQEEALEMAARHPGARVGAVEVRPLFDLSQIDTVDVSAVSEPKGAPDNA